MSDEKTLGKATITDLLVCGMALGADPEVVRKAVDPSRMASPFARELMSAIVRSDRATAAAHLRNRCGVSPRGGEPLSDAIVRTSGQHATMMLVRQSLAKALNENDPASLRSELESLSKLLSTATE